MSDDSTRIPPGYPSDKYPHRTGGSGYHNPNYNQQQSPYNPNPTPPVSSSNAQTRNIFIGAFATIIASTTVYYLTQYVNTKKSESEPTYYVMKEATMSAWKRYVTMDNIFYKGNRTVFAEMKQPEEMSEVSTYFNDLRSQTFKLVDEFVEEAESLLKEKNVDKLFHSMVNRRIKREKQSKQDLSDYINNVIAIFSSTLSEYDKTEKLTALANKTRENTRITLKMGANEIEDLSKALSSLYGASFDPNEALIYADFKSGKLNFDPVEDDNKKKRDTTTAIKNIDPKKMVGRWTDEGDTMALHKDGAFSYKLKAGDYGDGIWKIENDKLKMESTSRLNHIKYIQYFRIYDLAPDAFTMILTVHPFTEFNVVRVKN